MFISMEPDWRGRDEWCSYKPVWEVFGGKVNPCLQSLTCVLL